MINFSNEEIKTKSSEWTLSEDVKLLNKLKSLDQLLTSKSKEIIDNIDKIDNKITSESILINNLVNDFFLVGHKQFTENRVEEENKSKLYNNNQSKNNEEDSFKLKSIDQDTLIHEQMKTTLASSLNFIRDKLKEIDDNQIDNLNTDKQLEKLIKNNKYNQNKLPPIINSNEFINEIFNLVKENSLSKSNKIKIDNLETKSISETLSSIDSENISINEKIMEINENKFIEHLNNNIITTNNLQQNQQQLFASSSNDPLNKKEIKITNNLQNINEKQNTPTTMKSSNLLLDQRQRIYTEKDKIENINSLKNEELDVIFGKVDKIENNSKNKIFDELDSDDDLFTTLQSPRAKQNQKLATKDLFKSNDRFNNSSSSNESINKLETDNKATEKTLNLFNSNIKLNDNKKLNNKLFDSDSDDDDLFSSKLPTNLIKDKSDSVKSNIKEIEISDKSISNLFDSSDDKIDEQPINKIIEKSIEKETIKSTDNIINKAIDSNKIVKSTDEKETTKSIDNIISKKNKEITTIEAEKMSNKKDLFKNQLEDLFSKKRKPNQGFLKISKTEDDINDDNKSADDKNNENLKNKTTNEISTSNISPLSKQRKEFDLFSSKPSDDLFLTEDLNSIKTSTLDNNLVKSRVKFTGNRKRPTKVINQNVNDIKNEEDNVINLKSDIIKLANEEFISNNIIVKESKDLLEKNEIIKETIKTALIKNDKSINESLIKSKILFDDSDDDDDHKNILINKEKSIENISIIKDTPTFNKPINKDEPFKSVSTLSKDKVLFSDSEKSDDDDLFNNKKMDKKSIDKQILKESLDKKFKVLFDDSDDDELFLPTLKKS